MSSATNPAAPASVPPLTWQEWGLLASAYLSQFVASGFFYMALTAIPRERGAPLEQIGLIHMLGMVPGLKFFWVPLFDRYGFGARGHCGVWLALMQALLLAVLLWLSTLPMQADQPLPRAGAGPRSCAWPTAAWRWPTCCSCPCWSMKAGAWTRLASW